MSRRELIACDICEATRDSLEPSGVVLQAFDPHGASVVGDLCDMCWCKLLDALDVSIDTAPTSGSQRRLKRRQKITVGNMTIPLENLTVPLGIPPEASK